MLFLLLNLATASLINTTATAQDPANLETSKTEALKEIDERITKMQEHRACVNGATNLEALKTCRQAMREFHKDQKIERMEKRLEKMKEKRHSDHK